MENKSFKFGDETFTMIDDNLMLGDLSDELLEKYFEFKEKFTGKIDMSLVNKYESRIEELEKGIETTEDEKHKADLQTKLEQETKKFTSDPLVQATLTRKRECEGLILKRIMRHVEFIEPLFKKILTGGDHSKIIYNSPEGKIFIMEVITNFFSYTVNDSL